MSATTGNRYISVVDDHKAFLQYRWISSDIADLYHTEVPAVFRGKGVAKLLAKVRPQWQIQKHPGMLGGGEGERDLAQR